jgi:hypothetical protein
MATARNRQSKPDAPGPAGPADKGLRVIARNPQGMRRAGRYWGPAAETVSLADLTEDQAEAIRGEPALIVDEVDMPAAA